jgi:hypothetical protein
MKDGALVADKLDERKDLSYLVSKDSYKDFQIKAEFWTDEDANSGIFIRCDSQDKIDSKVCYEVNIFDKRPDPTYGTGAIVDVAKVDPMPKAAGKWNTYEITAQGLASRRRAQRPEDRSMSRTASTLPRAVRASIWFRRGQVPQGADQAALMKRSGAGSPQQAHPVFSGCAFLCHAQAVRMIVARSECAGRKFKVARAAEGSATR